MQGIPSSQNLQLSQASIKWLHKFRSHYFLSLVYCMNSTIFAVIYHQPLFGVWYLPEEVTYRKQPCTLNYYTHIHIVHTYILPHVFILLSASGSSTVNFKMYYSFCAQVQCEQIQHYEKYFHNTPTEHYL